MEFRKKLNRSVTIFNTWVLQILKLLPKRLLFPMKMRVSLFCTKHFWELFTLHQIYYLFTMNAKYVFININSQKPRGCKQKRLAGASWPVSARLASPGINVGQSRVLFLIYIYVYYFNTYLHTMFLIHINSTTIF